MSRPTEFSRTAARNRPPSDSGLIEAVRQDINSPIGEGEMKTRGPWTAAALAAFILSVGPAHSGDNSGFERMKSLLGAWVGTNAEGKPVSVRYELTSAGSALMETLVGEGGETMVTMYHPDGARLMLTHYCGAGNQPRMTASDVAPDARQITFAYLDATNLSGPDAGRMQALKVIFEDRTHFIQEWTWREPGNQDKIERFGFTRSK